MDCLGPDSQPSHNVGTHLESEEALVNLGSQYRMWI